jgi:hypothetical protein
MSLVHLILEYGAACWDPYREGHINMLDCVQKKAAKFADHTSDLVWETLAHCSKMACICAPFKVCSGEWAWKTTRDWLQGPCYLSPDDHDGKIRSRQQRTYREIFLCELDLQTLEPTTCRGASDFSL